MDFKFKIKVGSTEIEITESASNHKEFIQKLQFFTSLPTKGPKGAEDLKFVARKTAKGDVYYSLISEQDKSEFKLGQHKNKEETLYGKGWFDLFGSEADQDGYYAEEEQQQAPVQQAAKPAPVAPAKPTVPSARPIIGKPVIPAAKLSDVQVPAQEPVAEVAEEVTVEVAQEAAPAPVQQAAKPAIPVIKRPAIPVPAAKPATPVAATTNIPAGAPAKPLPSANVNSVLAKYGINKQQ